MLHKKKLGKFSNNKMSHTVKTNSTWKNLSHYELVLVI